MLCFCQLTKQIFKLIVVPYGLFAHWAIDRVLNLVDDISEIWVLIIQHSFDEITQRRQRSL